jgi:hypothetical protein
MSGECIIMKMAIFTLGSGSSTISLAKEFGLNLMVIFMSENYNPSIVI